MTLQQLTATSPWTIVFALMVGDVLWGIMTFALEFRRKRGGKGFSPIPPLLFAGYVVPCFFSPKSLVMGLEGYGILRLLESLITLAALTLASFSIAGFLPWILADRLARSREDDVL